MSKVSFFQRFIAVVTISVGCFLSASAQKPLAILPAHVKCDYQVSEKAETQLRDKMLSALTSAGLATVGRDASVALWPSISVVNEQTTSGIQSSATMELNYTFTLVSISSGVASDSFVVRGIKTRGQSKVNAVARSFASIDLETPEFQAFLRGAQAKVLNYYKQNMQQVVAKAQTSIKNKQYEEAISMLLEVPEETPGYTAKVLPVLERVYTSYAEQTAAETLQRAQAAWAAAPDEEGAEQAAKILESMPVGTKASAGARQLVTEIKTRLKSLDQRRWDAINNQLTREHRERMSTIRAARDVAVAYAKRPTVYVHRHVHVWY